MTARPLGEKLPRGREMALPIYSVDNVQEAKSLFCFVGKFDVDGKTYQNYRLPFSGNYEDLDEATLKLHEAYQKIKTFSKQNKEE